MDWSKFETMDPDMLVGLVNTSIRNHHGTLQEFCSANAIDEASLKARLAEGDYEYSEGNHQFR